MTGDNGCKSHISQFQRAQIDSLHTVLSEASKSEVKRVALFTHAFPDPDALGSMMGMTWILERVYGLESHCFYHGEISHPQNSAIVNLLDPQLKRVDDEYDPEAYSLRILLDTIPTNAGTGKHTVNFDAVIDHHKDLPNGGYEGLTVHLKCGSCCAIIYRLMQELSADQWLEHDSDQDRKVATAMIAGVITDTDYMVSDDTTEHEFDTYSGLFDYRHSDFLKKIIFFTRPKIWIDTKAAACQCTDVDDEGYAIVGLGLLTESHRDLIADMANDMVAWASVETAIAFAVVGGDRLEGSVRSRNNSLTVADFCRKLGGKHGQGGGKQNKGAYRFSLGGLSIDADEDEDVKKQTWETIMIKEIKRIRKILTK